MTPLIPFDVLFGYPEYTSPRLSPDGSRLAFLRPVDGVLNIWIGGLTGDDAVPLTHDAGRGIHSFGWAHDNRHIHFVKDAEGDENWHVFTADTATGEVIDRTPFEGAQAQLVAVSERRPDEMILAINATDPRRHDLYRLDLRSGRLEKSLENLGFDQWLVDRDLVVRGALRTGDDGTLEYLIGEGEPETWEPWLRVSPEDNTINTSGPLGFDEKGDGLFLLTPAGANATQLARLDMTNRELEVLLGDPIYDVSEVWFQPTNHLPQVAIVERERRDLVVLDPSVENELATLREANSGDVHLVSRDQDDRRWVIAYKFDSAPTDYVMYDRVAQTSRFLFHDRPALRDYELATMTPFSFDSSDGWEIHGYATFPPGVEPRSLPTVLHVHGGPWGARHSWGYDDRGQWLANRGYLCLEINFRGSGGYGKAFLNASAREWAGKMHDDLIEGARFAIDQGWTDPDRVGIFGVSYGGYAALAGATFTPDFFRCAVDVVGPSNLLTLLESLPPYWQDLKRLFGRLLGDLEHDRDLLWERSPLSRVDQIRIPVLIAQGANDPRVKQAESEQIVAAMRERGIDHEYLLFADEGHGFIKPENRKRFYDVAERFLEKHLRSG